MGWWGGPQPSISRVMSLVNRVMPLISRLMLLITRLMPVINSIMLSINAIDLLFAHSPCPPDHVDHAYHWPDPISACERAGEVKLCGCAREQCLSTLGFRTLRSPTPAVVAPFRFRCYTRFLAVCLDSFFSFAFLMLCA